MIRVLVLNSDTDGVGYWRCLMPHMCINDPEIKIDIRLLSDFTLPLLDPNFLRHYNIIFYNKIIPFADKQKEDDFYKLCKDLNIKLIYDIDDYWILDSTHINYKNWVQSKTGDVIENIIRRADVVTTTTPIFADRIRQINPNVFVLENAINIEEQQWISNKTESDRVRFIWGGGISHMVDLKLIKNEFKKFDKEFLSKAQMIMCGYDLRIKMGDGSISKDLHNRSQWGVFENIFSNDGKYIMDFEYRDFLKNSDNFDNDDTYGYRPEFLDRFYQRRHTKPILAFGSMYNEADVSLAALKGNHNFNLYKSQLKLVECSAHKMPLIASKTGPYTIDNIDNPKKQMGFLVDENKCDWYEKMKWYTNNKNAIIDHGMNAYEYFLEHFEMKVVNKKRTDLYKFVAVQDRENVKLD